MIGLKYSRDNEREADKYGMDYMVKSGYDPMGMVETMDTLEKESKIRPIEFFSTHPNPENRKNNLLNQIAAKNYPPNLKTGQDDYRKYVINNLK